MEGGAGGGRGEGGGERKGCMSNRLFAGRSKASRGSVKMEHMGEGEGHWGYWAWGR